MWISTIKWLKHHPFRVFFKFYLPSLTFVRICGLALFLYLCILFNLSHCTFVNYQKIMRVTISQFFSQYSSFLVSLIFVFIAFNNFNYEFLRGCFVHQLNVWPTHLVVELDITNSPNSTGFLFSPMLPVTPLAAHKTSTNRIPRSSNKLQQPLTFPTTNFDCHLRQQPAPHNYL